MTTFAIHSIDSAPAAARDLMRGLKESFGFVPNLAASMAESPALLQGFLTMRKLFHEGSFTPGEVEAVALAGAFENGCDYCMALHSTVALRSGTGEEAVRALRRGDAPADARLAALTRFARGLVRDRGRVGEAALQAFLAAGYSKAQALEVVLGTAVFSMPNFAHHLVGCALDDAFAGQRWQLPAR